MIASIASVALWIRSLCACVCVCVWLILLIGFPQIEEALFPVTLSEDALTTG